jgi:hypothetical protein
MEASSLNKRQRLILQAKELVIFAFLLGVRIYTSSFAGALSSPSNSSFHGFKAMLGMLALVQRGPLLISGLVIFGSSFVLLASGRLLPRKFLDAIGIWMVIHLLITFAKINLLLFTPTNSPGDLLGNLVSFLVYFVVMWGWIYWRLDWKDGEGKAGNFALSDSGETLTMFDYMYSSVFVVQKMGQEQNLSGLTRLGRVLVSLHNFMVLDLVAIGLGRFYQLIQKAL